jgi:hypothetical protein
LNEVQCAHWNRPAAVINPFVAYVKGKGQLPEDDPTILSYVVVSNVAHQKYVTVHLCIKSFLAHLIKLLSVKKNIIFRTAQQQYKNK